MANHKNNPEQSTRFSRNLSYLISYDSSASHSNNPNRLSTIYSQQVKDQRTASLRGLAEEALPDISDDEKDYEYRMNFLNGDETHADEMLQQLEELTSLCRWILVRSGIDRSPIDQLPTLQLQLMGYWTVISTLEKKKHPELLRPNSFVLQAIGNNIHLSGNQRRDQKSLFIKNVNRLSEKQYHVQDATRSNDSQQIKNFALTFLLSLQA